MTGFVKKLNVICSLVGMLSAMSLSQDPTLRPPEELLERAKKSRVDLIEVIGDIERLAPKLSSKEQFYPYLLLLPELLAVERSFGGEEGPGSDLIKSLGAILTRNAVKWFRLDMDSPDVIRFVLTWSENSTRYEISGLHLKLLLLENEKESLLHWFGRTTFALEVIQDLKSEAYVRESYETLQANCLERIMKKRNEFPEEKLKELLEQTHTPVAIQAIIAFLNEQGLKSNDLKELETYLDWSMILGQNLNRVPEAIPYYILAGPGQLAITIVTKFLTLRKAMDLNLVGRVVEALQPSQIPELGGILLNLFRDKPIPDSLVDFLAILSSDLYVQYQRLGLGNQAQEMRKFVSALTLLQASLSNSVEGSYTVTVRDKPGLFNLVHLGNGRFYAGLSVRYGGEVSADFSFFQLSFNNQTQTWEGVHYDSTDPNFSNPVNEVFFMSFKLTPEGSLNRIEGTFYTSKLTSEFRGQQTARFLNFSSAERVSIPKLAPVYVGSFGDIQLRLILYQSDQRLQGAILVTYPTGIPVSTDLEYGYYDPHRNVAYLSSGRFESLRWVQVRGEFFDGGDRFEGQYIQSVYGALYELKLRKE